MYKKFLVPMLLTVALAGCGHQSSDKQTDQTDTALPVQDQITTPTPSNEVDQGQQPAVNSSAEPTQQPPAATNGNTTVQQPPASGTDGTTPAPAAGTSSTTPSTPPPTTDNKKDTSTSAGSGVDANK